MMTERRDPCRRALLSVSDKTGLVPFARRLVEASVALISTGGTARALREAGLPVQSVSDLTGFPECFDGRVKTLHPAVHGGILQRRDDPEHRRTGRELGIEPIDLVVVNLYPFARTVANPECAWDDAIEQVDIGGPSMVRAAAKNHADVTVVVDPQDYDSVADAVAAGGTTAGMRRQLALAAFRHTAAYDAAICRWMAERLESDDRPLPRVLHEDLFERATLRYGENPHQAAALYGPIGDTLLEGAQVLQGKTLSYNNIVDLDAALDAVAEFDEPAAVVVKHTNPCGVGWDPAGAEQAWAHALAADPVSAFGGIVAFNRTVEASLAEQLAERFLEVLAAPEFSPEALETLKRRQNLRVVRCDPARQGPLWRLRTTRFGHLAQTIDPPIRDATEAWDVVTQLQPSEAQQRALAFAWRVCKHVKSNAIVLAEPQRTLGIGAGQMSRVDAVELAVRKATGPTEGAVLASDAFFPFRDGLDRAADAGVRAIVQPGGSRRDDEVIAAANERGIAMVFTGARHFRH